MKKIDTQHKVTVNKVIEQFITNTLITHDRMRSDESFRQYISSRSTISNNK